MFRLLKSSLSMRLIAAFILGTIIGFILLTTDSTKTPFVTNSLFPVLQFFGDFFIKSLKALVVPIIFFSLISGSSKMPLNESGAMGIKLMTLYFFTSLIATVLGLILAIVMKPGEKIEFYLDNVLLRSKDSVIVDFWKNKGKIIEKSKLAAVERMNIEVVDLKEVNFRKQTK